MTNEQIQALKAAAEMAAGNDEYGVARRALECVAKPELILSLLAAHEADKALIAKLQNANAAQDDHINQQADRIGSLEQTNAGLGKRLCALEARTLTVKLPQRYSMLHRAGFDEPYHTEMVYIEQELVEACAAAGITLVVGGE